MLKTVLFDLDGTLLPLDQDEFTDGYFSLLGEELAPRGYEPGLLRKTILGGTVAMMKNDGSRLNSEVFWEYFAGVYGEDAARRDKPAIDAFYDGRFSEARRYCGFDPGAAAAVRELKARGYRVALATNPVFPRNAMRHRIEWAGLSYDEFEFVSDYENSRFCKPNPAYFTEFTGRLAAEPGETLMVGNDMREDLAAVPAGLGVFFITRCLINRDGADISRYPHGDFGDLLRYIEDGRVAGS